MVMTDNAPTQYARNRELARRNRRIKQLWTRKRDPWTQEEIAAHFGISQPTVSLVIANPNSHVARADA